MPNALERLCAAIGYPEPPPAAATAYTLMVDGGDVAAQLSGRRLILSRVISRQEPQLPQLAAYAAGRMLREEAVLAWDSRLHAAILWQEAPDSAEPPQLVKFFEAFTTSCDWWLARAAELGAPPVVFPDIVIRP